MSAPRRLGRPRPVAVAPGPDGVPERIGVRRVEAVLEDWVVEDRWWTSDPVRRRYLEVVLEGGRCVVVFHDVRRGLWFSQRG